MSCRPCLGSSGRAVPLKKKSMRKLYFYLQLYEKVWAALTIAIVFISKSLGVWLHNFILIYHITDGHSDIF